MKRAALKPVSMTNKSQVVVALAEKLMEIMQNHIGRDKSITRDELFYKIFKQDLDLEHNYNHWGWWEFTKKAMHFCRQRTNCFIVILKQGRGDFSYCVAKDALDLAQYTDYLEENILRMANMIKKGQKSVDERWYRLPEWTIQPAKSAEQIE
jgi:hypothetical protein